MYSQAHELHCDKPLCGEVFPDQHTRTRLNLWAARAAGWHVSPCTCAFRYADEARHGWRHKHDYCPAHFPERPKPVENLPALLPGFTLH